MKQIFWCDKNHKSGDTNYEKTGKRYNNKYKFLWWKSWPTSISNCISCKQVAIEGFTESLRQELDDFNINIVFIEPGYVSSGFLDNSKYAKGFDSNKSPYAMKVQQVFQGFESITAYSSHPSKVAQTIVDVLNSPNPELRNPVGKDADSIFKTRAELSDKEMEQWSREAYVAKKGFIRQ